jgi:hypothetical protein
VTGGRVGEGECGRVRFRCAIASSQSKRNSPTFVSQAPASAQAGQAWRVARPFDANVLRQVSEVDVGAFVVLVFRAISVGHSTVSMALTKGDASAKALDKAKSAGRDDRPR